MALVKTAHIATVEHAPPALLIGTAWGLLFNAVLVIGGYGLFELLRAAL